MPYVVTRLDYTAPSNDEPGRVFIELKANAKGSITNSTLRISAGDIVGRTVAEIFAAKGLLKETPELIEAYDETAERYFAWRGRYGAQFSGRGTGFFAEDPNSSHRDMDWSRKDIIVLSSGGGAAASISVITGRRWRHRSRWRQAPSREPSHVVGIPTVCRATPVRRCSHVAA